MTAKSQKWSVSIESGSLICINEHGNKYSPNDSSPISSEDSARRINQMEKAIGMGLDPAHNKQFHELSAVAA